jgi:release factor glutamine methyltransferase
MIIDELLVQSKIDRREAELLLAFTLKKDRPYVKAHSKDEVNKKIEKKFLSLIKRRQKNEPIAYLIGSQPFFGRDFIVNKNTLIPRPETEELIDLVLSHSAQYSVVVDVGTGSGCIATTLALEIPRSKVIASDASGQALKIARQNAKKLGAKVEFFISDLLGPKLRSNLKTQRVIFVANLPYLPNSDKKTMMLDVTKYEPAKALFTRGDGSMLIVKLLKQIRDSKLSASMFFEIDPRQSNKLATLANKLFPNHKVAIKKDHCGRDRFLLII